MINFYHCKQIVWTLHLMLTYMYMYSIYYPTLYHVDENRDMSVYRLSWWRFWLNIWNIHLKGFFCLKRRPWLNQTPWRWFSIIVHSYGLFSSPELKAQVSFSDHILSVACLSALSVCKLFTFSSSIPEPLGQFQTNLAQSILK